MCFDDPFFGLPFVTDHVPWQGTTVNPVQTLVTQPCPELVQSDEVSWNVATSQDFEVLGNGPSETPQHHPSIRASQPTSHHPGLFPDINYGFTRRFTGVARTVRQRLRGIQLGGGVRTTCQWQSQNSSVCGQEITGEAVPRHLAFHGIQNMSRGHLVQCCWRECGVFIKRQSLTRHLREAHLGLKRKPCTRTPSMTLMHLERTTGSDGTTL